VSSKYESDLFFQRAVFLDWISAGAVDPATHQCLTCKNKFASSLKDQECRPCRVKHSFTHGLNNKVLEIAKADSHQVMKAISNIKAPSSPSQDAQEVIGRSLAHAFPEQIAELLLRSDPDAGAFLLASNMKGFLSSTSAVTQAAARDVNHQNSDLMLAMTITSLTSGRIILDHIHLVRIEWLPPKWADYVRQSKKDIQICFQRPNLNRRYRNLLLKALSKNQNMDCIVVVHDKRLSNLLKVYGPRQDCDEVGAQVAAIVTALISADLDISHEISIGSGTTTVTVSAAAEFKSLRLGDAESCKLRVEYPPVSSKEEFRSWIISQCGIKESSIKDAFYMDDRRRHLDPLRFPSFGLLTLKSPEVTQLVLKKLRHHALVSEADENCQAVVWRLEENLSDRQALQRAALDGTTTVPMKCLTRYRNPVSYVLTAMVQPAEVPQLKSLAKSCGGSLGNSESKVPQKFVSMYFKDSEQRQLAMSKMQSRDSPFCFVKLRTKELPAKSEHLLVFRTTKEANSWYHHSGSRQASGEAKVVVRFGYLIPELESLASRFAIQHGCDYKIPEKKKRKKLVGKKEWSDEDDDLDLDQDDETAVIFHKASPDSCGKAAKMLKMATAPLRIVLSQRQQLAMLTELHLCDFLHNAAESLDIHLEEIYSKKTEELIGFTLYGPGEMQGSFMREFTEAALQFQERYALIPIDAVAHSLLQKNRFGVPKFQTLVELLAKSGISCTFVPQDVAIQLVIPKGSEDSLVAKARVKVGNFLQELGSTRLADHACAFCHSSAASPFTICGHFYCFDCLRSSCTTQVSREQFPILCPAPGCSTRVHISDIKRACSYQNLIAIGRSSIRMHINQDQGSGYALCLREECGGILLKSAAYSTCSECGTPQCPSCGVINDFLHIGVSCAELAAIAREESALSALIDRAHEYVRNNWNCRDRILSIQPNRGLSVGCPALQRYAAALRHLHRGRRLMEEGKFAWHGAPKSDAIASICHDGFDPGRRSRQVYGNGEYFGVSASVSHGYCKGGNNMILAHILFDASYVASQEQFCYVVKNPTNWEWSYCLPVLVVNFGTPESIPWKQSKHVHVRGFNAPPPSPPAVAPPPAAPPKVAVPHQISFAATPNIPNQAKAPPPVEAPPPKPEGCSIL
jgi:hypothetical protein